MSLQFYFGPSGSGKSSRLQQEMLQRAAENPKQNILFIVPDQFTMQTQFDLVNRSPGKGIMNIDVLSFGRLSHRIFEETGYLNTPVLDDTGKNLILRLVTERMKEELPVIGQNLHRLGYVHEVKSAISEFMQYGISVEEVGALAEYAKKRGNLYRKLLDLQKIYAAFLSEMEDQFVTTEETMELLTRAVEKSELIRGSLLVFDGFTGFTPIQNRLIQRLMELTEKVIVSITLGINENPYQITGQQELFYLSKKTVRDLDRLAKEASIERENDVLLMEEVPFRFLENQELAHLERQLFRYPMAQYEGEVQRLHLLEARDAAQETRRVCRQIREIVLSGFCQYREIAIVTGNLSTYGDYLEREAKNYDIPMFLDQTRGLLLNPFIELIRSSLKIALSGFSYESVFHYLRSGMLDFTEDEIDRLENYVLALGIKGKKKWSMPFVRRLKGVAEDQQLQALENLNRTRAAFFSQIEPFLEKRTTAWQYVTMLYEFLVERSCEQKLAGIANYFKEQGQQEKAREYAQIYRKVMDLLSQIATLLPEEEMSLQEFAEILDAGFSELEIGIIPGSVDRVVAGDIERTRLKQVKVLFFLGVNDGNIPKDGGGGGIISDIDREYLQESEFELAPTPRQEMYIQRLYLYMNLTKPSDQLYLSFSRIGNDGKSIRPSYLVDLIKKMYPSLVMEKAEREEQLSDLSSWQDGMPLFAKSLRNYAEKRSSDFKIAPVLYKLYHQEEAYREQAKKLVDEAFLSYQASPLSKAVAKALYGELLENSVSRLEQFATCAYSHFLQYGLSLKEREEYSFEQTDLGNVFHSTLECFAGKLAKNGKNWFTFTKEEGEQLLKEALEETTAEYGDTILYSSARYEYMVGRIYRILKRTIFTLQKQLQGGAFVPKHFEMSFSKVEELSAVNIALSEKEKMKLKGRIDRIDTYEDDSHVYVKVIDYKSGNKKFDLAAVYYGLQLQLVVYMNVATQYEQKQHPDKEIVPAALLYYHVADPLLKEEKPLEAEEIQERLLKELRTTGVVSSRDQVAWLLDRDLTDKSLLIPVERKKDGSFSASSSVLSGEDYETVSAYVSRKLHQFGKRILNGDIAISPCENACTYCSYKGICSYDEKIPGYETRVLIKKDEEELLRNMKEELNQGE